MLASGPRESINLRLGSALDLSQKTSQPATQIQSALCAWRSKRTLVWSSQVVKRLPHSPTTISPTSFPTAKGASLCQTPELGYSIKPHSSWGTVSANVIFLYFWVPSQNTGDKLIASLSFLTYSGWNFLTAWLWRSISASLQFSVRTFPHVMYIDVFMRGTESHILLHYLDSTSSILTILVQIVMFLIFHKENLHVEP